MKIKHFSIRLSKEYLAQDEATLNDFLETVEVKQTNMQVVSNGTVSYWSVLVGYEPLGTKPTTADANEKLPSYDPSVLPLDARKRYEALRKWRNEYAEERGIPAFIIAHNASIGQIAEENPASVDDLFDIWGLGESKVNRYGEAIMEVLKTL